MNGIDTPKGHLPDLPNLSNRPERDPDRIDGIIDALRDAWKEQPNLRLGQLLSHLCADAGDRMWMVEDEQLLGAILGEIGPWDDGPDFGAAEGDVAHHSHSC